MQNVHRYFKTHGLKSVWSNFERNRPSNFLGCSKSLINLGFGSLTLERPKRPWFHKICVNYKGKVQIPLILCEHYLVGKPSQKRWFSVGEPPVSRTFQRICRQSWHFELRFCRELADNIPDRLSQTFSVAKSIFPCQKPKKRFWCQPCWHRFVWPKIACLDVPRKVQWPGSAL